MHHHNTIKTFAKAYLRNHERSGQDAGYHILPQLKLKRIFPAVYFVNINLPERRVQVLLREIELSKLPEDSPNIFKVSDIGRYMKRQCATLSRENTVF